MSLTAPNAHNATLAILCGGRSQRLGTDKGLFKPLGDESLFARSVRLLGDDFAAVLLVTRDEAQATLYREAMRRELTEAEQAKVEIVADAAAGYCVLPEAAIAGVHTALWSSTTELVTVMPVDQIGVRPLHLRKLLGEAGRSDARAVAFAADDQEILPFPSVWRKGARERVAARMEASAFSVKGALTEVSAHTIPAATYAQELELNGNTATELRDYFGEALHDPYGRRLHYLRFSLTEACNLSCTYCLPDGFPEWYRHKARLGMGEIDVLLKGFRELGFRKVRFTGGEPTVHPKCLDAISLARKIGYERIAMTTNGLKMTDVRPWIDAGLTQLNVSLDALDADRFAAVTGSRAVDQVIKVVEDAAAAGLLVKINTVLLRTKNGDRTNIERLIDWALDLPVTLRFIELMETKLNGSFSTSERVLGTEILPLLESRGLDLEPVSQKAPDLRGPATDYQHPTRPGRIGLINPMSCNFCSKCNRLRVTAKGRLKLCLFGDQDIPLALESAQAVALNVRRLIGTKPERHYLEDGNVGNVATFRTIGG